MSPKCLNQALMASHPKGGFHGSFSRLHASFSSPPTPPLVLPGSSVQRGDLRRARGKAPADRPPRARLALALALELWHAREGVAISTVLGRGSIELRLRGLLERGRVERSLRPKLLLHPPTAGPYEIKNTAQDQRPDAPDGTVLLPQSALEASVRGPRPTTTAPPAGCPSTGASTMSSAAQLLS